MSQACRQQTRALGDDIRHRVAPGQYRGRLVVTSKVVVPVRRPLGSELARHQFEIVGDTVYPGLRRRLPLSRLGRPARRRQQEARALYRFRRNPTALSGLEPRHSPQN